MRRTVLLYVVPAALIASGWLRLEDDSGGGGRVFALGVLALLPALVRPVWGRALAALAATFVAVRVAFGVSPLDARPFDDSHDFFGPLLSQLEDGFLAYYDVPQPFDVAEQPLMHGIVLVAIFGFCLATALAIAARRPLAASFVLLVGAVWPATLVSNGADVTRGAVTLAAVLSLLAAGGRQAPRTYRPALLAGVALVAAALAAVASSAVAKDEFVSWRDWDFYDRPDDPVGVRYVWDASYDGVRFPDKATKVLTITGPKRAVYWRATTLDVFESDRWLEHLRSLGSSEAPFRVDDSSLPVRADDDSTWIEATVEVEALRDDHLAGASMPVAYDPGSVGRVQMRSSGVAVVPGGLERGESYSVWSYAPRPTPDQLARSELGAGEVVGLGRFLEVAPGIPTRAFGIEGRERRLADLFADPNVAPSIAAYWPLYQQAREVVGRPDTPYAAVVALEAWFRSEGGFAYDEQPGTLSGAPPLVEFVTRAKRGYCQHYAGAMALMLRYLGIPARIAVGFTSGKYEPKESRWTVTDHNAHAWVEVWFEDWGWLPFDPTPARGQLSGTYTVSSQFFDSTAASRLAEIGGSIVNFGGGTGPNGRQVGDGNRFRNVAPSWARELAVEGAGRSGSLVRLLFLLLASVVGAVVLVKLAVRRARFLTRDPRRLAGACRRELVDYLVDQQLPAARSLTLGELGDLVEREYAVDAEPFVGAVARARFGPPRDAGAASRAARQRLRELRRAVRRRVGLVARLRGAVSLRSLAS